MIDADATIAKFQWLAHDYWNQRTYTSWAEAYLQYAAELVENMPTVDAVEVIHCEHCKHHEKDSSSDSHWCFVWETFTDNHVYCSFAERREDGTACNNY